MVLKARGECVRQEADVSLVLESYVEFTIGEEQETRVSCSRSSIGAAIRVRPPIFLLC